MKRRAAIMGLTIALWGWMGATSAHAGPIADAALPLTAQEAVKKTFADERFQTEMPLAEPRDEAGGSDIGEGRSDWTRRKRATVNRAAPPLNLQDGQTSLLGAMFAWILVGVLALGLLVFGLNEFRHRRRDEPDETSDTPEDTQPVARPAPKADDARALAAEGRYDEAIHRLLERVLTWVIAANPAEFPRALTTREVVAGTELRGAPADALTGLVNTVERSLFGHAAVDADDWERCAARFEALRMALHREGAP